MNKVTLTIHGAIKLQNKLQWLKKIKLPTLISFIRQNQNKCNLKTNLLDNIYLVAINICLTKIQDIQLLLLKSKIVDLKNRIIKDNKVFFSSTVILKNIKTKQILHYKIVGEDEADLTNHTISISSPLASLLLEKREGDKISLNTYLGIITYKILHIKFI